MRLRSQPFVVKTGDPFAGDILDRRSLIEKLVELICEIEGPHLLAIDGSWGSGKTVILQMLAEELRRKPIERKTVDVIELNAWETSFADDPLAALLLRLSELDKDSTTNSPGTSEPNSMLCGLKETITNLETAVTLRLPFIGFQIRPKATNSDTEINSDVIEALRSYKNAIDEAKTRLGPSDAGDWVRISCIDELDRCRPEYAVRFLEMIQHLVDTKGKVVFVVAVNLTELINSICAIYGTDFDSATYLRKFVDHTIRLPQGDRHRFIDHLLSDLDLISINEDDVSRSDKYLRTLLDMFVVNSSHISLRDMDQGLPYLCKIMNATPGSSHPFRMPLKVIVATMMVFRMAAPYAYRSFVDGKMSDLEALEAINRVGDRPNDWWKNEDYIDWYSSSATMEAILIGWARQIDGSGSYDSALLEKRRSEAQDLGLSYPSRVVAEASSIVYTFGFDFIHAQLRAEAEDTSAPLNTRQDD